MLYVTQLEHNKYYVGYSARLHNERLLQHINGEGALWTRKYKPVDVIFVDQQGQREAENALTLHVMHEYGWYNVRGGSWCQVDIKYPPRELASSKGLQNFRLNPGKKKRRGSSPDTNVLGDVKRLSRSSVCTRCGRAHSQDNCYARTDVKGQALDSEEEEEECEESEDEAACDRCGRTSHTEDLCYAKTDIDGVRIF